MLQSPRIPPKLRKLARHLCLPALTFALSAAQLSQSYAPCALAVVALAGPKLPGFFCLLGAAAGTWAFFDFQPGLRFLASAILIVSFSTAFYDAPLYRRPHVRPAAAAAMTALVQSVYLLGRPAAHTVVFALSLVIQWASFLLLAPLADKSSPVESRSKTTQLLLLAACAALVGLESGNYSLGRALLSFTLLLTLPTLPSIGAATALGLAGGLWIDLAAQHPQVVYAAICAGGCALSFLAREKKYLGAALFCLGITASAVLLDAAYPRTLFYEALSGGLLFCCFPRQSAAKQPRPAQPLPPPSPLHSQMALSAAAFRELYDSFFRGSITAPPENPSVIFDRAAEAVCRKCVLCSTCWHENYNATYNAFNDACGPMLQRGQAQAQDFPLHFTSRCVHLQPFLTAINGELRTFLLRQQYHRRLLEARRQAQEQYAQLGELLLSTAAVETVAAAPIGYRIGSALRPREGCRTCGDQLAVFEAGSTLYLLLSDGMGSGEDAHREAAMTVRLLQQFLQAGIDPAPAIKTLNAALRLRSEDGGGFTTIDLLALQRGSGSAALYKCGAAPSYLKRSGLVSRFTSASLPAGLQQHGQGAECCRFSLPGGSFFVMVSDGIADETDDEWLQNLLSGWSGRDADALTQLILSESRSRKGLNDDCAVLVVYLPPPDTTGKTQI